MKLPLACMDCVIENQKLVDSDIATVEPRDDGRYEMTCPKGHKSITVLQEQKFELLFDIGAYAITDGYYREAVSSFKSSLERFYEFFIKAALLEKGLDASSVEKSWKPLSKSSERQLGAFVVVYTSEFETPPPTLDEDKAHFRNDVIHQGRIPYRHEAIEYGQAILDLVRPALREAKERYPTGIQKLVFEHLKSESRGETGPHGTISLATIISLNRDDEAANNRSLEQAITELRRWA